MVGTLELDLVQMNLYYKSQYSHVALLVGPHYTM